MSQRSRSGRWRHPGTEFTEAPPPDVAPLIRATLLLAMACDNARLAHAPAQLYGFSQDQNQNDKIFREET
jgi:hypothetical protein